MKVRAIEWRPSDGEGWTSVAPEQWGPHTVAITSPLQAEIKTPEDLKAALPDDYTVVGKGEDQLATVFGDVWRGDQEDEIAAWWGAVFPQLENPIEVAGSMREWDSEESVMAALQDRAWNLFRLRLAVPLSRDCKEINAWAFANVVVLGRALLVFWFGDSEEQVKTSSQVDARARRGHYERDPSDGPITDLATSYLLESVRMIKESAEEAIKDVEEWETGLFRSVESPFWSSEDSLQIASLGAFKYWSVGLRQTIDGVTDQINKGQFRARWSTEQLQPIDDAVDSEIEAALTAVGRLRVDVGDAFDAANTVAIARQLTASQEQQKRSSRLEGTVTRLTAFLLVPTLVAAIFGANVRLPGDGWVRTALMIAAMVAGAVLTFVILRQRD